MSQVLMYFDQSHAGKNITDNNSSYTTQFCRINVKYHGRFNNSGQNIDRPLCLLKEKIRIREASKFLRGSSER